MNTDEQREQDVKFIEQAIELSRRSIAAGGFPIGAVIVKDGEVLATGVSNGEQLHDPTSHAETAAIREACGKLETRHLDGSVLYSSLEPCMMCFASSDWARIGRIVYACDTKLVPDFDETKVDIHEIAPRTNFPMELIYMPEFEAEAFKVIDDWRKASQPK
jgi:tRNA(Arg) A34 adenosine deaminase TadA